MLAYCSLFLHFLYIYICLNYLPTLLLVTLAFGIPSIIRERQSYLSGTIQSLLQGLTDDDRADIVLIVFIGDVSILFVYSCRSGLIDSWPPFNKLGAPSHYVRMTYTKKS